MFPLGIWVFLILPLAESASSLFCDPYDNQSNVEFRAVFHPSQWLDIDEETAKFSITGALGIIWSDAQQPCMWPTASEGWTVLPENQTVLAIDSEQFWTPSIVLLNSATELDIGDSFGYGMTMLVFNDHSVQFWPTGRWSVYCDLSSLAKFPFDVHTCQLTFEHRLPIEFATFTSAAFAIDKPNSRSWTVKEVRAGTNRHCIATTVPGPTKTVCYSQAQFTYKVKRKSGAYAVSIFLPCIGLNIVQLSTLAIPGHIAERSVFSVAILLTFAVIENDVRRKLPISSEPLIIEGFTSVNLILSFVCILYVTISLAVAEALISRRAQSVTELIKLKETQLRIARKVDIIAFGILALCLFFVYVGIFAEMKKE